MNQCVEWMNQCVDTDVAQNTWEQKKSRSKEALHLTLTLPRPPLASDAVFYQLQGWTLVRDVSVHSCGRRKDTFQGAIVDFSKGGQQQWNFILLTLKLREKLFSTKTLTAKYQMSNPGGTKAPPAPSFRRPPP